MRTADSVHGIESFIPHLKKIKKLLDKMIGSIYKTVSEDEDSVRIYTLCAGCVKDIVVIGRGEVSEDKDVYII